MPPRRRRPRRPRVAASSRDSHRRENFFEVNSAMQTTLRSTAKTPLHVALIMDGNGRWATRRGLGRPAGHRAGAEAVRRVIEAAPGLGIGVLSLFAFSADNWRRPRPEVAALMRLLGSYLRTESAR